HGYFEGRLEDECARAAQTRGTFALVRLHLEAIARDAIEAALADALAPADVAAAYAPNEYELLLLDAQPGDLAARAGPITKAIASRGGRARAGTACFPEDGRAPEELVERACKVVRRDRAAASSASKESKSEIVVRDPAMLNLERLVERVASGSISVLLLG